MKGPAEAVAPGTVVSRSPHGRGRCPRSLPGSSARCSRSVSETDTVEGQTSHQEEKRLASRQQGHRPSARNPLCACAPRLRAAGGGRAGFPRAWASWAAAPCTAGPGKTPRGAARGPRATAESWGPQGRHKSLPVQNPLGAAQPVSVLWLSHEKRVAAKVTAPGRAARRGGAAALAVAVASQGRGLGPPGRASGDPRTAAPRPGPSRTPSSRPAARESARGDGPSARRVASAEEPRVAAALCCRWDRGEPPRPRPVSAASERLIRTHSRITRSVRRGNWMKLSS